MAEPFHGWEDFCGKIKLLSPQPGDILVITGVEFPRGEVEDILKMAQEKLGVEVKLATFVAPEADAWLEAADG